MTMPHPWDRNEPMPATLRRRSSRFARCGGLAIHRLTTWLAPLLPPLEGGDVLGHPAIAWKAGCDEAAPEAGAARAVVGQLPRSHEAAAVTARRLD